MRRQRLERMKQPDYVPLVDAGGRIRCPRCGAYTQASTPEDELGLLMGQTVCSTCAQRAAVAARAKELVPPVADVHGYGYIRWCGREYPHDPHEICPPDGRRVVLASGTHKHLETYRHFPGHSCLGAGSVDEHRRLVGRG